MIHRSAEIVRPPPPSMGEVAYFFCARLLRRLWIASGSDESEPLSSLLPIPQTTQESAGCHRYDLQAKSAVIFV
jgi:hypothetical protein